MYTVVFWKRDLVIDFKILLYFLYAMDPMLKWLLAEKHTEGKASENIGAFS